MSESYTYYAIRHVATRELMPQAKRNRGYTHWNPSVKDKVFEGSLGIPRILHSRRQANTCIIQWFNNPNLTFRPDGDGEYSEDIKDDGRKREDLEVVEIQITIKE